jgi:hypothetical protein
MSLLSPGKNFGGKNVEGHYLCMEFLPKVHGAIIVFQEPGGGVHNDSPAQSWYSVQSFRVLKPKLFVECQVPYNLSCSMMQTHDLFGAYAICLAKVSQVHFKLKSKYTLPLCQ